MMRVHAPEKNCCGSRQPDSGRFAPRGFANRAEDKETAGEHKPIPLDFDMMSLPLYPPVQAKLSGGSAGDEQENENVASSNGTGEKAPAAGQVQPGTNRQEPNRTGMPDRLKAGIEALSGIDMSDVRVHANSPKPARLGALAYTQGNQIHIAPGQWRHLAHEAWHVVQQAQGRVRATKQLADGIPVNGDEGLEWEADKMRMQVAQFKTVHKSSLAHFSIANAVFEEQRNGPSIFHFSDNQPEAIAQRKMQEMKDNRHHVQQLRSFLKLPNSSSQDQVIQRVIGSNSVHWDNPGHEREKVLAYQYDVVALAQLARARNVPNGHKLVLSMERRPPHNRGYLSHYVLVVAYTRGVGNTTENDEIVFVTAYFSHGAATQGEINSVYANMSGTWRPNED